jgi:hypothetical protein
MPGVGSLLNDLEELATRHPVLDTDEVRSRTRAWVDKVHHLGAAQPGLRRVTISHEGLSEWPIDGLHRWRWPVREYPADWRDPRRRQRPHPLAAYLTNYLVPEWSKVGSIRLCITLRNQTDWLASLYAQISNRIASASQQDFSHQVRMLIAHNDPALDFHSLVNELGDAVGHRNLRVFLFEDIASPGYWRAFAEFVGLNDVHGLDSKIANLPRLRVRSTGVEDTWRIRSSRRSMPRAWIDTLLDRIWPSDTAPAVRRLVRGGSIHLGRRTFGAVGWRFVTDRGRGEVLRVPPQLREEIRQHCSRSNQNLADFLGRDLATLGY